MSNQNLPQHFRYINPIIDVLRESGGSGRSSEVADMVIKKLNISDVDLRDSIKSGASRIKNQIHWARMVLVKIGFIDSSQRGVWSLTEKGLNTDLARDDLVHLYKTRREWMDIGKKIKKPEVKNYLPKIDDFIKAYTTIAKLGEDVPTDKILDQIKINAESQGYHLKDNWRFITEKNIFENWA